MTFRPHYNNDDDEAPPPYEAGPSANTGLAANSTATPMAAPLHHQLYPVLTSNPNPGQYANDGTTSAGPPPLTSYHTDMNAAPLYPQYPVLTSSAPHNPFYTVMTSAAPASHPQAYPSMPFQASNGSFLRPYPAMQGMQPQQHQSSAPRVYTASAWDAVPSAGMPSSQSFASQAQEYNLVNLDEPSQTIATTASAMGSPPLSVPALSPALPPSISTATPVPALPLLSQSVPTAELPELVTIYKCRKCGATLESESAICRRIHTLTFMPAERQVQEITEADLEERRQCQERPGQSSLSLTSSSSTSALSDGSALASAPSPIPSALAPVPVLNPVRVPLPAPISSPLPVPSLAPVYISAASPMNNHGTNDVYLRRSMSVQNPMTTLKKFWRDAKGEFKNRQSWSTQYEFVSPPPLQPQTHLVASMHSPPPPPVPSPYAYSHAPPQAVPTAPPVQPWLAPSSAPSRSQF
ncbi:hypothetical protein BGZ51_008136 [Haplosporangium sp. Z 767]|nr:hypothetical protein BGZ51_008136 [Haplosporangium sp. Z 767]